MSEEKIELTTDSVKQYLEDHPEGLRLRELQAYFNAPRDEVQEVMNELEDEFKESFPVLDIPDDVLRPVADYRASYTWSENDRLWIASLPECRGVIATGESHVACRDDLIEALRTWISFRVWRELDVPDLPGVDVRAYASR
jgi:predicted RNase H-like HicB family nuclease